MEVLQQLSLVNTIVCETNVRWFKSANGLLKNSGLHESPALTGFLPRKTLCIPR
jgi:hypothetical protein